MPDHGGTGILGGSASGVPAGSSCGVVVPVALFASGTGSNVAALLDHSLAAGPGEGGSESNGSGGGRGDGGPGEDRAEPGAGGRGGERGKPAAARARPDYRCLIGNNSGAPVMALASARSLAVYHVSSRTHPEPAALAGRLQEILHHHRIELIVLAGYMKQLPAELVSGWPRRILNIHPALLPRHGGAGMYGMAPHRAVLAAGERETGVTVHWVSEAYDRGPMVLQRVVAVEPGDSAERLAQRVMAVEHDTYWRVVQQVVTELAAGRQPCPPTGTMTGQRKP